MRRWFPILICLSLAILRADAIIDVSLQLQLGNPSGAMVNTNNHDHYLIQRTVEAIDYSDNLGEPVWASWDLTAGDVGSATRSTTYFQDTNLPPNFTRLTTTDYNGVGSIDFNRGHLCPSEDRTDTESDNDAVFWMSNIMPQSGPNNQGVWGNLESYCRTLASSGNELLILCGPSGFGTNKIPSGKAYIGSNVWKIVVSVPLGSGTALSRLSPTNRVIAVSIPNVTNGLNSAWQT
jgi:endonuclease G